MARRSGRGHGKADVQTAMAKYINAISFAAQFNLYAKGVAAFLGVTPEQILNTKPVQHWQEFAQKVQAYANKWITNYKAAYKLATPIYGPPTVAGAVGHVFGPVSSTSGTS
jgi:hypothetical protein